MDISDGNFVDDAGTDREGARDILRAFCDNGFDGDAAKAGLVLDVPQASSAKCSTVIRTSTMTS